MRWRAGLGVCALLCLAACESKADTYLRLTSELATDRAQVAYLMWQHDTLELAAHRPATATADRLRAAHSRDSVASLALALSSRIEHAQAELAVLR